MKERLLWIDLETTGLYPSTGWPLEVGCILTDRDLNIVYQDSRIIAWSEETSELIRDQTSSYVREMHEKNGLWEQVMSGVGVGSRVAEEGLLRGIMLSEKEADHWQPCRLAGSKPSFDRLWLQHWFPLLARVPHYRDFDMGTVRALLRIPKDESPAPHRAIEDIQRDIRQLRMATTTLNEHEAFE